MRVLLVGTGVQPIPPTGYGGVERTIAEYATALRSAGQDCQVLNEVRTRRGIDEYRFAWRLPKLISGAQFDVLHASTPVVANRLAMMRRPFVYTSHSRHWFERSGFRERFGFWLERRAVHRASATVALTSRLADTIRSETGSRGPRRLEVIPIGVATDRFRPDWTSRNGRRVLGVGVVRPFKRWTLAAQALRGTGATLTIVGPIPDPAYAKAVRTAGDAVQLVGEVDEPTLTRLYAESDLLVHPSRVELIAGAVLQGLSAALPIVGAAPVADLVQEGETGFVSPPRATESEVANHFSSSARRLLGDEQLRRRCGEAARKSAIERFGWPTVVERHLALYRSLVP